jgi:hypothetical protein
LVGTEKVKVGVKSQNLESTASNFNSQIVRRIVESYHDIGMKPLPFADLQGCAGLFEVSSCSTIFDPVAIFVEQLCFPVLEQNSHAQENTTNAHFLQLAVILI